MMRKKTQSRRRIPNSCKRILDGGKQGESESPSRICEVTFRFAAMPNASAMTSWKPMEYRRIHEMSDGLEKRDANLLSASMISYIRVIDLSTNAGN
jgi:hypothetical protein